MSSESESQKKTTTEPSAAPSEPTQSRTFKAPPIDTSAPVPELQPKVRIEATISSELEKFVSFEELELMPEASSIPIQYNLSEHVNYAEEGLKKISKPTPTQESLPISKPTSESQLKPTSSSAPKALTELHA
ncbi:hypothetical protein L6452_35944 [Arctium lappa]|uniref:Uncharacterized protein n=1 Tax=Arctium lappa TaxID=4217 RepID=A0ACB8Y8J0_ARCLA|nr:hypothetical protein L6452_35944 [Arctium lappa]